MRGGFKNATFVEAGKRLRELGALEPFQPGYLATKHAESSGMFGDGKAAMDLMGQWLLGMREPELDQWRVARFDKDIVTQPGVPNRAWRQGQGGTDTLGGVNGWLVGKSAPPGRRSTSSSSLVQAKYAQEAAENAAYIPVVYGSEAAFTDPLFKRLASDLATTTYHQTYFEQDLGPAVGRVINDVSVAVAAGEMTPELRRPLGFKKAADQQ